jgi:hypothetical protein
MVEPQILSGLRNKRNTLLQQLDAASSPGDFAVFQANLAAEIIRTERLKGFCPPREGSTIHVEETSSPPLGSSLKTTLARYFSQISLARLTNC